MIGKKIYPIGTKVKIGDSKGMITQIKFSGEDYCVIYLISYVPDSRIVEQWLYSMEFTTECEKIKIGLKIT